MSNIDIQAIQLYLQQQNLDGWLIFDFRGQNYIAAAFFEMPENALLTRRWFYFIPKNGEPALLVHRIERTNFPKPPRKLETYVGWQELLSKLGAIVKGCRTIAMEYSPQCAIPYVSCVDAGTFEMVRGLGLDVVTSANLVQYFQSRWSGEQVESHTRAVKNLDRIKNDAFALIRERIQAKQSINEYEVQLFILEEFRKSNMISEEPPIVAVNANASNPHYAPSASRFSPINNNDTVLIDLFSKEKTPNAVYGDITWVGYVGKTVPQKQQQVFQILVNARESALRFLADAAAQRKTSQGWQVDKNVRDLITSAGYGDYFFHRTGHSLDTHIHGNGVNIDSLETQDQRDIIPGVGFTIEPGIYLEEFGLRTEINVYYSEQGPQVFSPRQNEIIAILK
ncbi:MAG TPA: M24 family metallopeptidase [bacterium]